MSKINWTRLLNQEGGTRESVPLLPRERSLLIKMLWILEDNLQEFIEEDVEDIGIDTINEFIDTLENALSIEP